MSIKWLRRSLGIAALAIFGIFVFAEALIGRNDLNEWQVVQYPGGTVEVRNEPGLYYRGFAKVTTYPEMIEVYCTKRPTSDSPNDNSARAPFNDGGYADLDWYARVILPKLEGGETSEAKEKILAVQLNFHRQFRNIENARNAIRAHGRDCISRTGATMSSTENQATHKGEFYERVLGQVKDGLYKMQKVTIRRRDSVTELLKQAEKDSAVALETPVEGQSAEPKTSAGSVSVHQPTKVVGEQSVEATDTVLAAEIARDASGKPIIMNESPLTQYGMRVHQFSISATEYDQGTEEKFAVKKGFILEAEKNKAEAVRNAQQRLLTIAEGDRKIAETEWKANETKAERVIAARLKQEVATIGKELAEVKGQTKVKVAEVNAKVGEQEKLIAEKMALIAENEKKAAELLAQAREQMIEIGGAASDYEKKLLEIQLTEIEAIALAFEGMEVPDTVIMSAESVPVGSSPLAQALPSLRLLDAFGITQKQEGIVPSKWRTEESKPVSLTQTPATTTAAAAQ